MPIDYAHQQTGAAFLAERRFALLADEPGLGKSRSTILAADLLGVTRILVICPGAIRQHWAVEFEQWGSVPRPVTVEEGFLTRPPGQGVTIVSHATLGHLKNRKQAASDNSISHLFAGAPYDLIVIDESHSFSRFDAQRTRSLLGGNGLASQARHVWMLSGTPVVNSAADLYPLVFGAIGSQIDWLDFCRHYCVMKPDSFQGEKPTGIRNAAELAAGLRPYVLRRTIASLGIELPPLQIDRHTLDIDLDAVTRIMAGLEGWSPEQIAMRLTSGDGDINDAAMARVRRALGMTKAPAVAEHIGALAAVGEGPFVVFFQHTDVRKTLYEFFSKRGASCSWIDGTVTAAQLRAAREWFQAGHIDILLVQTQTGGQGLTLTRSHRAIVAELPWTAAALFQAIKRIHRIGQTAPCFADILSAPACWLDEVLSTVVSVKQRASDELMDLLTSAA